MMLFIFITQLLICQDEVQWALTRIARESSIELATLDNGENKFSVIKSPAYFTSKMSQYVKGSGVSISMLESKVKNDEINLVARYSVRLPFQIFKLKKVEFYQCIHTRAFVGVESREGEEIYDKVVYVAETGRVYHLLNECTYLKLSISQVLFQDVEEMRNNSGGKYKSCESCLKNTKVENGVQIYITNYGDRYHIKKTCSGIKRTIFEMKLSEVGNRSPCSKCGK